MVQPLKVLIIDDSPDDAHLLVRQLTRGGFQPQWERVYTEQALLKALEDSSWEFILSDYTMPNFNGIEALRIIVEGGYDIPVILVSGAMGEEIAVAAMRGGAQDYLIKDNLARLAPAVERSLREAQNRRARAAAEKALIDSQSQLLFETQRRLQELDHLNRISEALRDVTGSGEMLTVFLDRTLQALDSPHGALFIFPPGSRKMKVAEGRGALTTFGASNLPAAFLSSQFFDQWKTVFSTPDIHQETISPSVQLPGIIGPVLALPFRSSAGILGVLLAGRDAPPPGEPPQIYQPNEINLVRTIADIGANALQRARLFEQTQVRVQRLSILHEIDLAVSASLSISITLDLILDQIVHQIGIQAADVLLYDAQNHWLNYGAGRGFRSDKVRRSRFRLGQSLPGRAVLERQPVSKENIQFEMDFIHAHYLEDEIFSTYFAIPLITKGQIKGVLELFHDEPVSNDTELRNFIESLAAQAAIAMENSELFQGLKRSNMEITHAYDAVIESWAYSLEKREYGMESHGKDSMELTIRLAKALNVDDAQLVHMRRGALLHDVGKVSIPEAVLNKPGPLTEQERQLINTHPQEAQNILQHVGFLSAAMEIPLYHHERWDGTGYSNGLQGTQIPLAARIFAVVDVWISLISERVYRTRWSREDAAHYIVENAGVLFDPTVVEAFKREMPRLLEFTA